METQLTHSQAQVVQLKDSLERVVNLRVHEGELEERALSLRRSLRVHGICDAINGHHWHFTGSAIATSKPSLPSSCLSALHGVKLQGDAARHDGFMMTEADRAGGPAGMDGAPGFNVIVKNTFLATCPMFPPTPRASSVPPPSSLTVHVDTSSPCDLDDACELELFDIYGDLDLDDVENDLHTGIAKVSAAFMRLHASLEDVISIDDPSVPMIGLEEPQEIVDDVNDFYVFLSKFRTSWATDEDKFRSIAAWGSSFEELDRDVCPDIIDFAARNGIAEGLPWNETLLLHTYAWFFDPVYQEFYDRALNYDHDDDYDDDSDPDNTGAT